MRFDPSYGPKELTTASIGGGGLNEAHASMSFLTQAYVEVQSSLALAPTCHLFNSTWSTNPCRILQILNLSCCRPRWAGSCYEATPRDPFVEIPRQRLFDLSRAARTSAGRTARSRSSSARAKIAHPAAFTHDVSLCCHAVVAATDMVILLSL